MKYPYATKRSMARLLAEKGYKVPMKAIIFYSRCGNAFWLRWHGNDDYHQAYYSAVAGQPILSVDGKFLSITLAEVIGHGLYREK